MEPTLVRYRDVLPVEVLPGVWRRTLVWGEHEQITYLVSGELEMTVGEEVHLMGPGDSLLIPSAVPHGVMAHKRTVVIDTFSPPREEFK